MTRYWGVKVRVRLSNIISLNPYNIILPKSCKKMRALYNRDKYNNNKLLFNIMAFHYIIKIVYILLIVNIVYFR